MDLLIPQGFHRIVCSELRYSKAEVYWNPNRSLLLIKVTTGSREALLGPFNNSNELEAIHHALNDVKEFKGRYNAC